MLTYPKATMRVWHMPMHLSSGHMTDAEDILPPPLLSNFPTIELKALGGLTLGFVPNF